MLPSGTEGAGNPRSRCYPVNSSPEELTEPNIAYGLQMKSRKKTSSRENRSLKKKGEWVFEKKWEGHLRRLIS
jgi:hypothetical protein